MCHQILGGKYYKSYLAGKQLCVRVFVRASECGTWASPTASPEGLWVQRVRMSFGIPAIYSEW